VRVSLPQSQHILRDINTHSINSEKARLASPTARGGILIATPGRLLDHLTSGLTLCPSVLVLDEADRLLDQGFRKDLERIVGFLPDRLGTRRQCMLFSATFDKAIQEVGWIFFACRHATRT
jgi:ATP-dependent RNA helicase MSS116